MVLGGQCHQEVPWDPAYTRHNDTVKSMLRQKLAELHVPFLHLCLALLWDLVDLDLPTIKSQW